MRHRRPACRSPTVAGESRQATREPPALLRLAWQHLRAQHPCDRRRLPRPDGPHRRPDPKALRKVSLTTRAGPSILTGTRTPRVRERHQATVRRRRLSAAHLSLATGGSIVATSRSPAPRPVGLALQRRHGVAPRAAPILQSGGVHGRNPVQPRAPSGVGRQRLRVSLQQVLDRLETAPVVLRCRTAEHDLDALRVTSYHSQTLAFTPGPCPLANVRVLTESEGRVVTTDCFEHRSSDRKTARERQNSAKSWAVRCPRRHLTARGVDDDGRPTRQTDRRIAEAGHDLLRPTTRRACRQRPGTTTRPQSQLARRGYGRHLGLHACPAGPEPACRSRAQPRPSRRRSHRPRR